MENEAINQCTSYSRSLFLFWKKVKRTIKGKNSLKPIEKIPTYKEGMRRAFGQSINGETLVVLFRIRRNGQNAFHCKIRCEKGTPALAWSEIENDTLTTWTAHFGPRVPEKNQLLWKLLYYGETKIFAFASGSSFPRFQPMCCGRRSNKLSANRSMRKYSPL